MLQQLIFIFRKMLFFIHLLETSDIYFVNEKTNN